MLHTESKASGPSAAFVQAFWQSTGVYPDGAAHRVLPDACADFIFNMSDPTKPTHDCATMVGTMTRAIVVPSRGRRDVFGIRFRPGAAWLLYGAPMRALCDGQTALDDILPGASHLAERLATTADFKSRIARAEAWIETRLASGTIDEEKLRTVTAINTRLESGTRGTNLATLDWNERKLQRFFETAYGPSPATMRCFWRFEHLRRALTNGRTAGLSTLAIDHGYADQAHMSREFQRFSGLSITAWRAETALAF
jgi:AraC-like DNA-binding protein